MSRIGLIRKRGGYWMFSSVFEKTLKNLIVKIVTYQVPAQTIQESKRERFFVEMARNMN